MKKLLFFAVAVLAISSCQKNPDLDELSYDYLTYTVYDPASFATPKVTGTEVFIPNAIKTFDKNGNEVWWNDGDATEIISQFTEEFEALGYDVLTSADPDAPYDGEAAADMVLTLTYVRDVTYYYDTVDPYWWWWDYWGGGYWPGWYYPYPYSYVWEYSVASLTAELIKPGVASGAVAAGTSLPVYWNAFIGGYDYGSKAGNAPAIEKQIPQAFRQSSYLQTAGGPI